MALVFEISKPVPSDKLPPARPYPKPSQTAINCKTNIQIAETMEDIPHLNHHTHLSLYSFLLLSSFPLTSHFDHPQNSHFT